MATTSPEIDLAALIADTEGEIVRLVRDRDPSTHGLYEMVRYHLALDGSGASGGKRMRPLLGLLAYASITGEHQRALPGRRGRRTRPQLLARPRRHRGRRHRAPPSPDPVGDPRRPAGDQHRRHAVQPVAHRAPPADRPRLPRPDRAAPDAPLRRDLPGAVRGPVPRHRDERVERPHERRSLLRHDRAQDRGAHRRLDRGRRAPGDRGRGGHRPLPRVRLGARPCLPAQRRPARDLGARSRRPARSRPTWRTARRRSPSSTPGSTPVPRTASDWPRCTRRAEPTADEVAEVIAILERTGAREYTRDQARRYRDEALHELDAAGVVKPEARARLQEIIVSVISA